MKYFWTLFWTFALVHMIGYVAGSMAGAGYDFTSTSILGVVTTILVLIFPAILSNEPEAKETLQ